MATTHSSDGTPIVYERTGDGPPVVLVGGAFSYRKFGKMTELAELLSGRFTVINYDRRGRGDSGDTPPYEVEREIEDLAAVIDAVGGSACVWGWSSGGALTLRAAASELNIAKAAVYEVPFMVEPSDSVPPADFGEKLQRLIDSDQRSEAVRLYMTEGMGAPRLFVGAMRLLPVWSKLKALAPTLPYDWAVLGDTMNGQPLRPEEWGAIRTSTLVLAGEKSPEPLRKAAQALAEVLPNAEHRVLSGQSHNVKMEALAPALVEYFGA